MAKRRATTELNRDNWDAEEEKEEPGTFKRLSDAELKNRIIKKAKRTLGNNSESPGISPFAAFSGFAKSTSNSNPFSFFKKNEDKGTGNPFNTQSSENNKKENGNAVTSEEKVNEEASSVKQTSEDSNISDKQKPTRNIEYYRQLQSLNESVMKWMQLHLSKNSCCDFTPVFNDYKKHLDTLNVTYPVKERPEIKSDSFKSPAAVKEDSSTSKPCATANHSFKFSSDLKTDDETDYGANFKSNTTNTSSYSFGIKRTPTSTSTTSSGHPTTSFEEEAAAPEKKPFQFSFGLKNPLMKNSEDSKAKSFNFASAPIDKTADAVESAEDPEYVPPKNDFVAVKEEDAFYSKRCKLFCKKGESFVDRGIGTLHLKPLDGKTQLVIRADTSLGNILLNIVLSESLPMSRTGKNNVLLVCIPNPPIDAKSTDSKDAIPMLIRVKTSADADELLETLNKHKS